MARDYCPTLSGGHLAYIKTAAKQQEVKDFLDGQYSTGAYSCSGMQPTPAQVRVELYLIPVQLG